MKCYWVYTSSNDLGFDIQVDGELQPLQAIFGFSKSIDGIKALNSILGGIGSFRSPPTREETSDVTRHGKTKCSQDLTTTKHDKFEHFVSMNQAGKPSG